MKKTFTLILSLVFFLAFLNGNAQMVAIDYEIAFLGFAADGFGGECDAEPTAKIALYDDNNEVIHNWGCIQPSNGCGDWLGLYFNDTESFNQENWLKNFPSYPTNRKFSSYKGDKNSMVEYITMKWEYWEDDIGSRCSYDPYCGNPLKDCGYGDDDFHIVRNDRFYIRGLTPTEISGDRPELYTDDWAVATLWFSNESADKQGIDPTWQEAYEIYGGYTVDGGLYKESIGGQYAYNATVTFDGGQAAMSYKYRWNYTGNESELFFCNNLDTVTWTEKYPSWSFKALAGNEYKFKTTLPVLNGKNLLRVLDSDGHTVLESTRYVDIYGNNESFSDEILFEAPATGTYYVDVINREFLNDATEPFVEGAYLLVPAGSSDVGVTEDKPASAGKLIFQQLSGPSENILLTASETEICQYGGSSTLTVEIPEGGGYYWYKDNNSYYGNGPQITITEPGNYKVDVLTAGGCRLTSNAVTISYATGLVPEAMVNISSDAGSAVFQGQNVTFTANINNLGTRQPNYLWYDNTLPANYPYYYSGQDPIYTVQAKPGQKIACISTLYGSSGGDGANCYPIVEEPSSDTINLNTLVPSVSLRSDKEYFCVGENDVVSLTAEPVNSGPSPSYMWVMDGNVIPGANGPTYTTQPGDLDNLLGGGNAHYFIVYMRVFGDPCYACIPPIDQVSSTGLKYIYDKSVVTPTINIDYDPSYLIYPCTNQPLNLMAIYTNEGENPRFNWYINGELFNSDNSPYLTIEAPVDGDIISCQLISDAICARPDTLFSNEIELDLIINELASPFLVVSSSINDTLCEGDAVTLTATGNGSVPVVWMPGGITGNSITVNPSSTTTYTATAITEAGCIASGQITIDVNRIPSVPVIAENPVDFCQGVSVNLNASANLLDTVHGFSKAFAPENWLTSTVNGGYVDVLDAGNSIKIYSINGSLANVDYSIGPLSENITINFDWQCINNSGRLYTGDSLQYTINGVASPFPGYVPNGDRNQTGTVSVGLVAGQTFAFRVKTYAIWSANTNTTIKNVEFATQSPAIIDWYTVLNDGASIGSSLSGTDFLVNPPNGNINYYYAEARNSSCVNPNRTMVVVEDIPMAALCRDTTIYLDVNGTASVTAEEIDSFSTDACGIQSLELSKTNFDCSNIGQNTVTLTVTSSNNSTATCDAIITVQDSIAPFVSTKNITVHLDSNGRASITSADLVTEVSDNCTIQDTSIDISSFACSDVGTPVTVSVTLNDVNGNSAVEKATVMVMDTVSPLLTVQNITVQLDGTGQASITSADLVSGASDNCAIQDTSIDISSFACSNVGKPVAVTVTLNDVNGNSTEKTAMVTVMDTVSPSAATKDITVYLDNAGNATIAQDLVNNGSSDVCGGLTFETDITSFSCADVGNPVNVILTVTDINGNSASETAFVSVFDTISPLVVTKDISVYLDNTGNATIDQNSVNKGSFDACGILTFETDITDFSCTDVGNNTVNLTVTDVNGNSANKTATVNVLDTVSPVVIANDITVYLDNAGNAIIAQDSLDNGSSDACGVLTYETNISSFFCADVGNNTVTLTVSDVNGNSASETAIVTVLDTVAPIVATKDITVYLDNTGNTIIGQDSVDNGSSDVCGVLTYETDITSFGCANVGNPVTVSLTVTDVNGNSTSKMATVSVLDTISPLAITKDISVYLDNAGNATMAQNSVDNGSSDACGALTFETDVTDFSCTDVGNNTVNLTVTDVNGNSASKTAIVNVLDTVSPVVIVNDITVYLDNAGIATISQDRVDDGSSDACGGLTFETDNTIFACANVGSNTVTLTVTDENGNSNSETAIVIVIDMVRPVALTKDITVYLDNTGNATIGQDSVDSGSSDACGGLIFETDITRFGCADVGSPVTVILTVTDVNGNSASEAAIVNVLDTVSPVVLTKDISVYLDNAGNATITQDSVNNSSSDACGDLTFVTNITRFSCADVGNNTVTLNVTDVNGNSTSETATVAVFDTISPVVLTKDISIYLDNAGIATISQDRVDNGSSDACGGLTFETDKTIFACTDVGSNTVTLTVTDENGNSNSEIAIVTVLDTVRPVALTKDITVYLDNTGNATIGQDSVDSDSSDACGSLTFDTNITSFSCADIGNPVNVTLTVTDINGNISTNTALVTVEDAIAPEFISCPTDFTVTLSPGNCETVVSYEIPTAMDNCSEVSIQQLAGLGNGAVYKMGPSVETYLITDASGNTNICSFTITVDGDQKDNDGDGVSNRCDVCPGEDDLLDTDSDGVPDCLDECPGFDDFLDTNNNGIPDGCDGCIDSDLSADAGECQVVCLGYSSMRCADLNVVATGGEAPYSYQWSNNKKGMTTTVCPAETTTYTVTVTDNNGCQANAQVSVEVVDVRCGAKNKDVELCYDGNSICVKKNRVQAFLNAGAVLGNCSVVSCATGENPTLAGNQTKAAEITTDISSLAPSFDLKMYPNPTKGMVTVESSNTSANTIEVAVMNIAGAEVFRKQYRTGDPIRFNMSDHVSGMYMVLIEVEGQRVVKKLILDRN